MKADARFALPVFAVLLTLVAPPLAAQQTGDDTQQLEAIEVTGSRIKRSGTEGQTPIMSISREELEATGINSIGDILQRLSVSSSALNTKFNSAGNFGFPADSGGVGSGSTTVSLRHLGAKRVLVLVDGIRWVNESSASGINAAVDLNTIPFSAVDRVELLTDGASSLYGSDAIAGVVNIITKKKQDHSALRVYSADYETGNGATQSGNVSLGGTASGYDFFVDIAHFEQKQISSNETEQSRYPVPGTGVANGSSAIPTTRSVFVDGTANALCPGGTCNLAGNGTAAGPSFVAPFDATGFHAFNGGSPTGDRFNFSPFNLLLTPSQRSSLFTSVRRDLFADVSIYFRGMFQSRESVNQAAPEPIFVGPGAGTGGIADNISIPANQPFNPFGQALTSGPGGNLIFTARRPLEGGPRVFTQNVETRYMAAGVQGGFELMDQRYFWDFNLLSGRNRATQEVQGSYNIAHIERALGDPANCTAPCVPLNFWGGPGTITPQMLSYISFIENDRSVQGIDGWSANISGAVVPMPAGNLEFAAGIEHRRLAASYTPDAVVIAGETNGVPSLPSSGHYSVDELYVESRIPILADLPAFKMLEASVALRYSDYSTFGSTTNSKLGVLWQFTDEVTARATYAEGFRAPSVGELYGSPARFDATITDPCNTTPPGSQAETNCLALGVPSPTTFNQANTQISVRTGGNQALEPESADSFTAGAIWSPGWASDQAWASSMDFELTYYDHEVTDSIQARDAQTQLDRCVANFNLDPTFCDGITRGVSGDINGFSNILLNLGTVNTSGYDLGVTWVGPKMNIGTLTARYQATFVDDYKAVAKDTGLPEPNAVGVEINDSSIPEYRSTLSLDWRQDAFAAGWSLRYISSLTESCGGGNGFAVCDNSTTDKNQLDATMYHDLRASWQTHLLGNLRISGGVNNVFGTDPPECLSCSLNGYDASLYDLPGQFGYLEASVNF
ncbi:MAG: TonB-dependent receptor domain-containing protein [Gammaproteobacteria bacterium]